MRDVIPGGSFFGGEFFGSSGLFPFNTPRALSAARSILSLHLPMALPFNFSSMPLKLLAIIPVHTSDGQWRIAAHIRYSLRLLDKSNQYVNRHVSRWRQCPSQTRLSTAHPIYPHQQFPASDHSLWHDRCLFANQSCFLAIQTGVFPARTW